MKIIIAIKEGVFRSLKSWKGILIVWILSLVMVSLLALPLKGALNAGFGKSMITEKLRDGFNIEVFTDLGTYLTSLISYLSSGLLLLILIWIILNAFLTGGLFNAMKETSGKFSSAEFFRASSKNFWPFLIITLVISLIIFFLAPFISFIPVILMTMGDNPSESSVSNVGIIAGSVLLLLLLMLLLVADYARAWQVKNERSSGFRAIGYGFKLTFRTFLSSFPLMIFLFIVQLLFVILILKILPGWRPATGAGVFLLFLVSQLLFYLKIMLRSWRYASITSLMEHGLKRHDNIQAFQWIAIMDILAFL